MKPGGGQTNRLDGHTGTCEETQRQTEAPQQDHPEQVKQDLRVKGTWEQLSEPILLLDLLATG